MRRLIGVLFAASVFVIASAHVGSPDVIYDGTAGPYAVRVIVRPPNVVPGLAEVVVRVQSNDVARVTIRPVFWRTGVNGSPAPDAMARVPGHDPVYTGQVWLMARGAYSVYVTVSGARGSGTTIVPVDSFATGRLGVPRWLGGLLLALGTVLVVGFLTLVRIGAGESLVPPGQVFDAAQRRRANVAMGVGIPIMALLLFGGAKWWQATDASYQHTMYESPSVEPAVHVDASHRMLRLVVRDTGTFHALFAPVVPDHGKMMHLFLVSQPSMEAFAHLHPVQTDSLVFQGEVPWLPAGRYRFFADLTLENGTTLTVTNTVDLPPAIDTVIPSDTDDAWTQTSNVIEASAGAAAPIGNGYSMAWTGDASLSSGSPMDLQFDVRDPRGAIADLTPYMGMAAHAVVLRNDDSVFIHLHPKGTVTTAAQRVFELRDRGDTTADGRVPASALAQAPSNMNMQMSGRLSFPYEFPRPGRYRIWVQVKPQAIGRVLTGTFDVVVR